VEKGKENKKGGEQLQKLLDMINLDFSWKALLFKGENIGKRSIGVGCNLVFLYPWIKLLHFFNL